MKITTLMFIIVGAAVLLPRSAGAGTDDFEVIRGRVVTELLRNLPTDSTVTGIRKKLQPDGSFSDIDYSDLSRTAGFPHRKHLHRLADLARAYRDTVSSLGGDSALLADITSGSAFWVRHSFKGDNWHNNQVTTPKMLADLMLLVGNQLPDSVVAGADPLMGQAHMGAWGARPGGDRITIAGIHAKHLLFKGEREKFAEIVKIIEGELKFATGHRGLQHDLSFHHRGDRVNNTDSYGYGKYANSFGEWVWYTAGTSYAFSKDKINLLIDYYLDGIYKQQVYGVYPDVSVQNRSVTNRKGPLQPKGTKEIERLLGSTDYRRNELEDIIALRKGEKRPIRPFAKFFWQTEHFVCQRPHFYTTVRMFSTRNRNMEEPYNGPGKPTHHRADGTNYVVLRGDEYHNIWPLYDWQKISGTTVLQKPALPAPSEIQKDGLNGFVGGITDGLYGAAVFDFTSPHDFVKAKKSWFFFDSAYVCLGTGIRCGSKLPVATTVNQCLMRGDVIVKVDGNVAVQPQGEHTLRNVDWVHHDGIGYVLPGTSAVRLANREQQGSWSAITDRKNVSDEPVKKDVFILWFDHSAWPRNGSYRYIVIPGISETAMRKTGGNVGDIRILSNSDSLQAVTHAGLGLSQLVFYRAGKIAVTKDVTVRTDSQGMVMLETGKGRIRKLTLADPSRKLGRMAVTVTGIYRAVGDGLRVVQDKKADTTLLLVDMPQGVYAGQSVTITL